MSRAGSPGGGAAEQQADVCVVGAGPNGLTLAIELARRGHSVVVLESRLPGEFSSPKSNHISARAMEIFRRMGAADLIRAQGLPDDFPNDGVYATRFTGRELTRFRMPARRDRFDDAGYDDGNLPSRERAARVSQLYLTPTLAQFATGFARLRVLHSTRFVAFSQRAEGVEVQAVPVAGGAPLTVRCRYLVGADGARSDVRRALGIRLLGEDNIVHARSRLFRAPDLLARCAYPRAWMNWFYVDGKWSSMVAIDGRELWLIHHFVPPGATADSLDLDAEMRAVLGVGADFRYETIAQEDWTGRRLIAERFRAGRCFIVGDAVHQWVPYGGYGMNAGVTDAANLAWMLDAVLSGWAPESLLDAHEAERKPVVERISHIVAEFARSLREDADSRLLEQDTPQGEQARQRFGAQIRADHLRSWVPTGFNFGYCYERSPIVVHDGARPPAFSMGEYQPSTTPGCRVPHFWLRDGGSLFDRLGDGFTLLRLDLRAATGPLVEAARRVGMPLVVLDVEPGRDFDPAVFREALLLVRPDQHIAWRGPQLPGDCAALVDRVRGAAPERDREAATGSP